ncbi:ectonucleotide pyrophosphatase/phosphodiesterase family member 3-like, partial [Notothenia coriiceps]|uniref:Ectonucleotide pyrophosphatase/phosphodiesterase family member 3-like n=1 Tax=Notothenia coriiceps TaxID=8208 RepID=A0A6I9MNJ4_9TELE
SDNSINSRLNLTAEQEFAAKKKHFPEGRPRMLQPNKSYCVLPQEGFITAYSLTDLMPLWSSFTIDKPTNLDPLPPVTPDCLRADVRIPASNSARCVEYIAAGNVTTAFLHPPSTHIPHTGTYFHNVWFDS